MYAGSTHQNQVLMAPYLVNWEGMKLALENKKDFYDLGGVFAPDKSDSLYTFKYMWTRPNGATEYIGEIDKVYDQAAYAKFIAR
jgi:lipid II:glycine glycyltransferase (peptidoglycan interpeptide bridge formation enzyme)